MMRHSIKPTDICEMNFCLSLKTLGKILVIT